MAVQCQGASVGITRPVPVGVASDYSVLFLYKPQPLATAVGRVVWVILDDPGTYQDYIAIFSVNPDPNEIYLEISDNGVLTTSLTVPIQENGYSAIGYVRTGTAHKFYVNGQLMDTLTQDVTGLTITEEWMGDDSFGTEVDSQFQYVREYSDDLTLAQVIAEWNSPTPIVTANLAANTPLTTNYEDTTVNNRDWTPIGSPTFVLGPTPRAATNTDGPTAQDLGDLSGAGWVQVMKASGGTTGNATYTYTPPVDSELVMSFWHFGQIGVYDPTLTIYSDEALSAIYASYAAYPAKPTVVPVVAGTPLWFKVFSGGGNPRACLWVRTQAWTAQAVPEGSILINDAGIELPAALLSSTTAAPLAYRAIPGGEEMVQLENGTLLVENLRDSTVDFIDSSYATITTIPAPSGTLSLATDRAGTFYVGTSTTDTIESYNSAGAPVASFGPVAVNLAVMWPSRDNTILYYAAGTVAAPVKQWNLLTDSAESDLAAGVANYFVTEIMTMADDSILVLYRRTGVNFQVIRYSAAGATLNTYSAQFTGLSATDPHLALQASLDPDSFWVWGKIPNSGLSRFFLIETNTGVVQRQFDGPNFTNGSYSPAPTADPDALFGHSESCTFVIADTPTPPEPPGPGDITLVENIPRRLRRAPHLSAEQVWMFYSQLQLDFESGVGLTTGQGSDPVIELRWSDDGGHTWSNSHQLSIGRMGQYKFRTILRRLGRSRDRVFEVNATDPVKLNLLGAYVQLEKGTA